MKFTVDTVLHNFALINYRVPPSYIRKHISPDFDVTTFDGFGLVSIVPFHETDFTLSFMPKKKFDFWQINYRTYVYNKKTGERGVWFFGNDLASPLVKIPKYGWGLPWHKMDIQEVHDEHGQSFSSKSTFSNNEVVYFKSDRPHDLNKEDFEKLTNPTKGFYYRRDGKVGTYSIMHPPMKLTICFPQKLQFSFLSRMGLDYYPLPQSMYSAEPIDFTIFLPPRRF